MISIHNITAITARASAVEGGNWLDLDFVGTYDTDTPTTITLFFNDPAPGQIEDLCRAINRAMSAALPKLDYEPVGERPAKPQPKPLYPLNDDIPF